MSFCHLHVHTEHSFLDGVPTLPGLVKRVSDLGQTAVAITDHGEVSGHLKFQKAALEGGIQPIFGMEGYFVDDVEQKVRYDYQHITLLATSQVGLTNLWKLSSRAYTEGMYYKPRLDWKMLKEHAEGIVATGGCLGGCIANYLIEGEDQYDPDLAVERMGRFMEILDDRFYLELHTFPDKKQMKVNQALVENAQQFNVPLLAVSDSHYLEPGDWQMHELLIAAQMNKKHDDPNRYTYGAGALHVMGEDEVYEKLTGHLEADVVRQAMDNTVKIAESAEGIQVEANRTYPIFLDKEDDDKDLLQREAWRLFAKRIDRFSFSDEQVETYRERLKRELRLVIEKGYAGYFLITADVVQWAKEKGMLVGPGRGSAGGSLLSYVLGIIELDPVANGLLFERFLDPNLQSLPDIDIDVPQIERHEVLEYLRGKYEVAGIGTLNTLKPKVLVNDFCRVLGISFDDNRAIIKIVESTMGRDNEMPWDTVYAESKKEFKKWEKEYPLLFELCHAFAKHYRHAGAHAAAVVVNREPLLGKLPLRIKDDEVRTQMEMHDVEELGYMKMDFLGLRTLSTLMRALEMANDNWTPGSSKPEPIPFYEWQYFGDDYYGDMDVYKSLWTGKTLGIFQIETPGGTDITKRYMPQSLEDMCAVVSLNRPGLTRSTDPDTDLSLLELFLQKREGSRAVSYHDPLLEPILQNTFGAFLYQEQVMQVVRDIGDFSPEDQTKVRKSIGKKTGLEGFKETFITNAQSKGMRAEVAEVIWRDMEKFGEYGFNKSHGFAYGMIAYWTAWVKYHYPEEFMTALFQTNEEEKKSINRECRRLEITLLGPDVNESDADFALVKGRIRYGFQGTKYVGESASEVIQANRPYASAADVVAKLEGTKVNKRSLESLIVVGALDSVVTDEDREGLPDSWSVSKVALYRLFRGKLKIGVRKDKGLDERGIFQKYLPEFKEYADSVKVDDRDLNEPEYLGEHVTTLPFGRWLEPIQEYYDFRGYEAMGVGEHAVLGGNVGEIIETKVKKQGPNKGRPMGWVWVEFPVIEDGKVVDIEARKMVCFPKEYSYIRGEIEEGAPIIAKVEKLADSNGYEGGLCLQSVYRIDRGQHPGMHSMVSVEDDPTQEDGYFD